MTWQMNVDPLGNIGLSALVAAIPIFFLFWALAIKRMKGQYAALGGTGLAIAIAIGVYKMPADLAGLATLYGGAFGLFPVCWIVITALFIYNMSVKTGQFEVIKNSLASISDDRRLQALLIAFSFGAFIEGAAGFGTPVAITAAMLAGLGFNPLYAACICLLANTAPVAWGAIGIPIVVGGQVAGIPDVALSQMVGRTLPLISIFIPLYLVIVMAGWKKGWEVWPACFVSGGSFAIAQYFSANSPITAPLLPDIIASLSSIVCTVVFLKFWHPKESWHFADEPKSMGKQELRYTGGQIFRAWAPFLILSLFVCAWGIKPVNQALNQITEMAFNFKIPVSGLDKLVIDQAGKPKATVYNFHVLSAAATAGGDAVGTRAGDGESEKRESGGCGASDLHRRALRSPVPGSCRSSRAGTAMASSLPHAVRRPRSREGRCHRTSTPATSTPDTRTTSTTTTSSMPASRRASSATWSAR